MSPRNRESSSTISRAPLERVNVTGRGSEGIGSSSTPEVYGAAGSPEREAFPRFGNGCEPWQGDGRACTGIALLFAPIACTSGYFGPPEGAQN